MIINSKFTPVLLLGFIIITFYYKFFLFGKIPFPGDLLVASYSPWFDYYKLPVQNPLISDVFSQTFLWKYLALDSLKNFQWPLWNPYSFSGTPLLANYQSASLYPLNILLLLPKYIGWGIFIFSQTLLASLNMYLLLSLWTQSKLARLIGAIIFALGGMMSTWTEWGTDVHAIAWLPLSLYATEKFLITSKLRYLLLLITTSVMLILAGHVQITTYSFIILIFYILINSLSKNLRIFWLHFLPLIVSLIMAIFISSPQLFTSWELLQKSIRLSESYTAEVNFGLLPVKNILNFFSADYFGSPVTRNFWGFLNYVETSSYMGILTIPLILFAIIYLRRNRTWLFFLILLIISLALSFDNPISKVIYQTRIPLLTLSFASRALFITVFATSILAAFSLDQILSHQNQLNKFFKVTIWSWAAALGILLGTFLTHQIIQEILRIPPAKPYLDFYLADKDYALSNFVIALRNSLVPFIIISVFLAIFILIKIIRLKFISKQQSSLICLVLFVLLVLDLSRYFLKFNPFVSANLIFPSTPAIEFLKNRPGIFRIGREHAEVFPPNTWIAYKIQSLEGYDPLYLNSYAKFIHFLNGGDLRTGSSSRYAEISQKYDSPFIDAANVRYFIGIGRDRNGYVPGDLINYKFQEAGYKVVFKDKSAVILENSKALDRVYFASSFVVMPQKQMENLIMTDQKFDPKTKVVLSTDLNLKSITGQGAVKITSYTANLVKMETQTNQEELLILADQFDDGWKAKIDNQPTPISRANLIFRAIKVPTGKHQVVFYYWPKSFDIGLKVSLFFSAMLSVISLVAIKKRLF